MSPGTDAPRRDALLRGWIVGVCVCAGVTLLFGLRDGWDLGPALLLGIGISVGAGRLTTEERQKLIETASWASPRDMRRADRYLRRPATGTDPSVRDLALLMAQHRLDRLERSRPRPAVFCGAVAGLFLVVSLLWLPRFWPAAAVFGALAFTAVGAAYWLRRRLRHLDQPPASP